MPKITGSTIIKLLIACFLVGLALVYFNVSPQELLLDMFNIVKRVAQWCVSRFGTAMSYILLGAVVVIPIWLVFYLLRAVRGRR